MVEPVPSLTDLEAQIRSAENATPDATAASATLSIERSAARSFATRAIVVTYVVILVGAVVFVAAGGVVTGDYGTATNEMVDLIKTALIPVVTFVIGHYFGSSGG